MEKRMCGDVRHLPSRYDTRKEAEEEIEKIYAEEGRSVLWTTFYQVRECERGKDRNRFMIVEVEIDE